LQRLCDRIEGAVGPFGHRVFTDSAPVLEKALARNAGLGWIGKHTNLIDRDAGSYFFLGEIYLDLELPSRRAEQRALRQLQRLPTRPARPARSSRPTGSMRGAASPI
jgi:epoxyqueuosine reductase QueG